MSQTGGSQLPGARAVVEFTQQWAHALGEVGYLTWGAEEAQARLAPMAAELAELVRAPLLDEEWSRQLGAHFASAWFRGPNVLRATLRVIRTHGTQLFDPAAPDRIIELTGEFAAGYAEGLRECIQREQESLLRAVLHTSRDAANALRASDKRFRTMFTDAGAGIALVALDGQLLEINPAMCRMFGTPRRGGAAAAARPMTDYVHPADAATLISDFRTLISGRRDNVHGEVRFVRPDGLVLWAHVTASLVRDDAGAPDYVIGVVEDVTERHNLRSRLRHQAYHDQLTRLPNRSLMAEQLGKACRDGSSVARVGLCHLNLDGFRAINDSLGHQVGDQLLLAVAGRLQLLAGEHLVTRAGGDEFSVLVSDPPDVDYLSDLAERMIAVLRPPFVIGQQRLSITASLGITEAAVRDTRPDELQREAHAARSWAKGAGGGRWAMFDAERDAGETTRFALAASVPGAVDRGEFQLFYQPLVQLNSGELAGVEALVRWRHPEHGLLGPSRFIDLAERNGAIVPLGRWVLAEACRQATRWADEFGAGAPYVSVNVAPRQLAEPGWLAEVSLVLEQTGLDPSRLQLEITERAVLVDESGTSDTLRALRDMGVRLVIDDFGTGYSSLSYLRRLPVHGLKIDGAFTRGLCEPDTGGPEHSGGWESTDSKIISALITLAHALDLVVTAEWVETATQARRLTALGCDLGQGNWFGDPVPARQLTPLLGRRLAG